MLKLKTVSGSIPWSDRTEWFFPASDKNRLAGEVTRNSNDLVDAMKYLQHYGKSFRVCVQAGGAVGVWPIGLATMYETVYTFEPDKANYSCLLANTHGSTNIIMDCYGLWHEPGTCSIQNDEPTNAGAGYVGSGSDTPLVTVDGLKLMYCDLIYLDIEGAEINALKGAAETIERCRPLIGVEEKRNNLQTRFGYDATPSGYLIAEHNYIELERYHLDVLLGPSEIYG